MWVGVGFLGFSHIETSELTQSGVGWGRPILDQFWMSVGVRSTFLGLRSIEHKQNPRGIKGLSMDGS